MRKSLAVVAAACAVALLAACSSGSKSTAGDTGASSGTTGGTTALTGKPIPIGWMGPVNTSTAGLSFPEVEQSMEVAVDAVNAAGGVKGRPLRLYTCDDQNDPNQAATCASELINQDKVVATMGGIGEESTALYPLLQHTGGINFAEVPGTAADASSPLSYPLYPGVGLILDFPIITQPSWKNLGEITTGGAIATQLVGLAEVGFKNAHRNVKITPVVVPATNVDWSTVVSSIIAKHYNAVLAPVNPSEAQGLLAAAEQLGLKTPLLLSTASLNAAVFKVLKGSTLNLPTEVLFARSGPEFSAFQKAAATFSAKVGATQNLTLSDSDINAWLAVREFAKLAATISGTITPAAFTKVVKAQTDIQTGMNPLIDFATSPGGDFPRGFNLAAAPGKLVGDNLVQTSSKWSSYALPGGKTVAGP
jgi:branched-chain amino acid transport system substrate-binding protein